MPKILFRADAEKSVGIGDLMSLVYLSNEFQRNSWQCYFAVRDYNPALQIIKKHKLKNVYLISRQMELENEIRLIKKICQKNTIDCLFMEITKNNLGEYNALGKPTPIMGCVNFDGVITKDFDIVVNWCVDSNDNFYKDYEGENIQFIIGFENTILPYYFDRDRISTRTFGKDVKKVLVSVGGIDEFDLTRKIITALTQQKKDYEIRVIVGYGYANYKELLRITKDKLKNFNLRKNVVNLFEDYLWADVAFSAGGLTSSELVSTRTPAILIAAYEHQVKRCEYYSKNKWAYYIGDYLNLNEVQILNGLDYMLNNINLFRNSLAQLHFEGGNEKIYKSVDSCRQCKQLV